MCSYKTTYSCDQCDYKEILMISLQAHIEYVHSNVTYTCDHCGYEATKKSSLKRHIEFKHQNII